MFAIFKISLEIRFVRNMDRCNFLSMTCGSLIRSIQTSSVHGPRSKQQNEEFAMKSLCFVFERNQFEDATKKYNFLIASCIKQFHFEAVQQIAKFR